MGGADYEIRNSSQEGTQGNRKGAAQRNEARDNVAFKCFISHSSAA